MRKVTVSMICGIIIGMIISNISQNFTVKLPTIENSIDIPPVATQVERIKDPFNTVIAPGLQIVEVPPPLDMNGRVPYQCYFNGQHIRLPKEVVQQIVAKHGNPSDNDPNFNVHNFTGNLKMIDAHVGSNIPTSPFPVEGRVR